MKYRIALCCALLLASYGTASAAPEKTDGKDSYLIECRVVCVTTSAHIQVSGESMTKGTNGAWNMRLEPGASADAWVRNLAAEPGVEILCAPQVVTIADQEAKIRIQQSVRYLEPLSNGLYRAVVLDESKEPGVQFDVTPHPDKDGKSVLLEVALTINVLEKMRELQDLPSIRAGAPVISSRSVRADLNVKLGAWVVLGGQDLERTADGEKEKIILILRAQKAPLRSGGSPST